MILNLTRGWSDSPEIKSDLINDKEETEARLYRTTYAAIQAWYAEEAGEDKVIFDKGRGWNHLSATRKFISPTGLTVVCVRNLADVFASLEKQAGKFPLLSNQPLSKQYNRADAAFSPEGMIGHCVSGVEDMLRVGAGVFFVPYETFVSEPDLLLDRLYKELGLQRFPHDVHNVENTANDVDGLYLNKYPHEGAGKIEPRPSYTDEWVGKDIQQLIADKFDLYNRAFGYGKRF
jgi:hypothetical protein